jgi:hypothetical protein
MDKKEYLIRKTILFFTPEEKYDLHNFLRGEAPDFKGRKYSDILNMTNEELEEYHDYIQCIFPTDLSSIYVKNKTVSFQEAILWGQEERVQYNLYNGMKRMLDFFEDEHWVTPENHNFKRISRIIRSLNMFSYIPDKEAADKQAIAFREGTLEFCKYIQKIAEKYPDIFKKDEIPYRYWLFNANYDFIKDLSEKKQEQKVQAKAIIYNQFGTRDMNVI